MPTIEGEIVGQEIVRLKKVVKSFKINTMISIFSFILSIYFAANDRYENTLAAPLLLMVFFFSAIIMFNIFLGILASLVQISVISWVGLNIIFAPLSYIFSYFKIIKKSNVRLNELAEIYESVERLND